MTQFFDNYVFGRVLGEGSYGKVFAGYRMSDGKHVAIKRCNLYADERMVEHEGKRVPFEIYALIQLRNVPGVVQLLEYYVSSIYYFIVMEYASSDLHAVLERYQYLDENLCKKIFKSLLTTVIACKERGFVHNDIKIENASLNYTTGEVKLLDFGNAEVFKTGVTTLFAGTRICAPPEFIELKRHDREKSTVWTLGILLYELCQGEFPFDCEIDILREELSFKMEISDEMKAFIRTCLSHYRRPTLMELSTHSWLVE